MRELPSREARSRWSKGATSALGGLLGGLAGAILVIGVTEVLKEMSQTARATCNLQIEKGPEERPPKTGAMRDCRIDIGDGCDALLN